MANNIGLEVERSSKDLSGSFGALSEEARAVAAEMIPQPPASAWMGRERGADGQNIGTPRLYTAIHGKKVTARLGTDRLDKAIAEIWEAGHKLLRKHFDQMAKHISISIGHLKIQYNDGKKIGQADFIGKIKKLIQKKYDGASDIQIDFRDMTLRLMQNGTKVEIKKEDLPEEVLDILKFLDQWQSLHTAAMEELGVHSWHARNDFSSNRSLHTDAPFVIKNANWDKYNPKSEEEYFAGNHFDVLIEKLPDNKKGPAREIIQKASAFRRKFEEQLSSKISEKEKNLEGLAAASIRAKALKKEIEVLKELKKKVELSSAKTDEERERGEGFQVLPVFTALGFWGSTNPADISQEALDKASGSIRTGLIEIFEKTQTIGEKAERIWNPVKAIQAWRGGKLEKDDLTSFATHAGGLLYHSDLDHLGYFDQTGAKRVIVASMEEFVVDSIMHLDDPTYESDLRSFGMQTPDPELQLELRQMVAQAADAVRAQKSL